MRIARVLTSLSLATLLALLPAAAAQAQPYPPAPVEESGLTVSSSTVEEGDDDTVDGGGFAPNETIEVTITARPDALRADAARGAALVSASALVSAAFGTAAFGTQPEPLTRTVTTQADGNGRFRLVVRLLRAGLITISARGLTSGRVLSATVRVLPRGSRLPITGSPAPRLLLVGGALVLALGTALVVLARPRRRPHASV